MIQAAIPDTNRLSLGAGSGALASEAADRIRISYRCMVLSRMLDEKLATLYRGGKIFGGVFMGKGQEALSVALGVSLRKGDVYAPLIRDGAGRLAFGETAVESIRNHLGSVLGPMRGREGNVHRGRPKDGLLPMISHLGAMISVVNGMLMAARFKGQKGVVGGTCIGDGGTSTGACHEALNQAAVERLPLVLVIADNQYAYSTPTGKQYGCGCLVDRAVGYGVEGHEVDGTDLLACLEVVGGAVARARNGHGPQMVVGRLLRLCGHGEHDDAGYVSAELKRSAVGRDCIQVAEQAMVQGGWATQEEIAEWRAEAARTVEAGVTQVQQEPAPDPYREDWRALSTRRLVEASPQV